MFQYGIEAHNYVVRGRVTYNVVYYTEKRTMVLIKGNISPYYPTRGIAIIDLLKMTSASLRAWAIASISK